ncbi:hypothetical protein AB0D67_09895 [Streptosporangium sp. NPDC048047]|uniref:hypothetical protein n=1 Tax=Streptosporangium sp. NPDC048047 TaxID=3155748 RepID=UPI003442FA2A
MVKDAIAKLRYLRGMDAHHLDLSMLPTERRRFLATSGRRSTVQGLQRRGERRYPILLALVAQSAVDQLDEVVALFDQAVSARESHAKAKTDAALAERAEKGEARQLLMDVILPVLIDPGAPDEQVGGLLRERIGMDKLREVASVSWKPLPRDHGRLAALEASHTYLRRFTPQVLETVGFHGGPGTADLMEAVEILKELNRVGGRKVPAGAPTSFVPARYADYLTKARRSGDDTAFRHYWEICTILALRDGLRSGDVFVPGSRRYADPGTYLFTPQHPRTLRRPAPGLHRPPHEHAHSNESQLPMAVPRPPHRPASPPRMARQAGHPDGRPDHRSSGRRTPPAPPRQPRTHRRRRPRLPPRRRGQARRRDRNHLQPLRSRRPHTVTMTATQATN